jgi:hypothetical protein
MRRGSRVSSAKTGRFGRQYGALDLERYSGVDHGQHASVISSGWMTHDVIGGARSALRCNQIGLPIA